MYLTRHHGRGFVALETTIIDAICQGSWRSRPLATRHGMSNLQTASGTNVGWWSGPTGSVHFGPGDLAEGLARVGRPLYLLEHNDGLAFSHQGCAELGVDQADGGVPLLAVAPACRPRHLGSASFARDHGVRF